MEPTTSLHIEIQANKNKTKSTEQNGTSDFCLDVAKYVFTGVFLASIFALINKSVWVIFISGIAVVLSILIGIKLNKSK
jgi:hypothetical protein